MEQQAILALGAVTLIGCGLGLVFLHSSNPLLKGLNWMGLGMMAGGLASALMLVALFFQPAQPIAYFGVLVAFQCCYRADQYLLQQKAHLGVTGYWLLAVQSLAAPLEWLHLITPRISLLLMIATASLQLERTIRLLQKTSSGPGRLPAKFTANLMRFLMADMLIYGVALLANLSLLRTHLHLVNTLIDIAFVAGAIALGFAFFWRATTKLTGELEHMASTDPLTRVFNRRVFLAWCEKEWLRSRSTGAPLSVLLLDFDYFKSINDRFGHHMGDQVLIAAVERMQDSIRGIDVLCRWGGEEFAVLLPNASPEATLVVAERIRQNIRQVNSDSERFHAQVSEPFQLTISVGAANLAHREDTIDAMLQRADTALYEAKDAGRDRVVLAGWRAPVAPSGSHELTPALAFKST